MSGWTVLAVAFGLWVAYKLGRATKAYSQYARGYMDGFNAREDEFVEAQRDVAARGLQ